MGALSISRLILGLLAGLLLVWQMYDTDHTERTGEAEGKRLRYGAIISSWYLPLFLTCLIPVCLIFLGAEQTLDMIVGFSMTIIFDISLFYLVLLLLLPVLRRYISARACAHLWILPNFLYFLSYRAMWLQEPAHVFVLSGGMVPWLLGIWLAGFCLVMGWSIMGHLRFRSQVLQDSRPVTDPAVLDLWKQEQLAANFQKVPYRLVISPHVTTPVTVGFFRRSTRVILPDRPYGPEELALIFRHELVHISREDAGNKFFLRFCCAFGWFNPLMWLAMSRSAQDLELSCDETVLLEADDSTRRRYADLLLTTAGDSRGFTTCLSSSAESLRYRLKNVIQPRKKFLGAFLSALALVFLFLVSGQTALAYNEKPAREYLFGVQGVENYQFDHISLLTTGEYQSTQHGTCAAPDALRSYLADLPLYRLSGNYEFSEGPQMQVYYQTPLGLECIRLENHRVRRIPLYDIHKDEVSYYVEELDWDYLQSLFVPDPKPEEVLPLDPELTLGFYTDEGLAICAEDATLVHQALIRDGEVISATGTAGGECYTLESGDAAAVTLLFSHGLADQTQVEVVTEVWTRTVADRQYFQDTHFTLDLAPQSAHYTVYATLTDGDAVWSTEFRFDVVRP